MTSPMVMLPFLTQLCDKYTRGEHRKDLNVKTNMVIKLSD